MEIDDFHFKENNLGFFLITAPPKGATLSAISDLGVSKERADFLGTLFESLHESRNSIFEIGLVGGGEELRVKS